MKISWAEPAVLDLESIRDFISRDSEYYAMEFTTKIIGAVENLSLLPSMGRKVPEIDDDSVREFIFHSYRIIYRFKNKDEILILGIIHAARDMDNINSHPWEIK